ncbi:MAG: hypothetical protein MI919_32765 [Holophagales bacterium]|nr:hypothetical protein [Holophagales bacterium]
MRAITGGLEGPWSEALRIEVSYPSHRLVLILGGLGSVLLLATVGLIVLGHRRSRTEEAAGRPEPGDG